MRSTEIKVGVMTIISVIVLFFGALYLNEQSLSGGRNRITIYFKDIEGLNKGDLVKVRGVKKGQIEDIHLEPKRVRVIALVDKDVIIKDDYIIIIKNLSLMGGQFLDVFPGTGKEITKLDSLEGIPEGSVTGMLARMMKVVLNLEVTMARLDTLLANKQIDRAITNAADLTANINDVINDNKQDLKTTLRNLRSLSAKLSYIVGSPEIREATQSFARIGPEAEELIFKLDRIANDLDDITSGVKKGKGSLGKVIKQEDLYNDLRGTLKDVRLLLDDIKKHPHKYIKVRVF